MKTWRPLFVVIALALSSQVLAEDRTLQSARGAQKAKRCTACHNGLISLKGRGSDVILSRIREIRLGNKIHKPDLDRLPESDFVDIARYLNEL